VLDSQAQCEWLVCPDGDSMENMPTAPPLDGGPFVATRRCQTYRHDFTPGELPSPLAQLAATCRIESALGRRVAAFV